MTNLGARPTVQLPTGGVDLEFTIHDRLAKARAHYAKQIDYPITQDEFAELVGCSGATVSNYELGNVSRLSDAILREWARVTGASYRWLKFGPDPRPLDYRGVVSAISDHPRWTGREEESELVTA